MQVRSPLRSVCRFLGLILIQSVCALAQNTTGTGRRSGAGEELKIGLVLSGGGARGLAHIGVLQWFEENHVPVDYITGTSMGGLIGGLYAMGIPIQDVVALIKKIDWKQAFARGPTYEQLSFRRQEDRRNDQVEFELGAKHGISLPTGLSSAHYISLIIDRLTLPYFAISSFDDLPIPYRCMATDFLDAESVTLKDGSLASAMRATMSIPGVFPPVEREGRVLVDGGLLDNIPTNAMLEMKPDVVIAVDIGSQLGDYKAIQTLGGILAQATTVMTIENDRRNLRLADIILAPELGNRSILDFSAIDKVIELGYLSAETKAASLRRFALDEEAWHKHQAAIAARKRAAPLAADGIEVTGVNGRARAIIRRQLEVFAGKPLDVEKLEAALTRYTGQGRYEALDYGFARPSPGSQKNILVITVREKMHAPPTLDFALELEASDIADIKLSVGSRLTAYDVTSYGSEWRNDIKVGFRSVFATELFQPLGQHGIFAAPRAYYRRGIENVFAPASPGAADYMVNRTGMGLDLGYLAWHSEFRVGYDLSHYAADVHSGTPPEKSVRGNVSVVRARWAFDGTDSAAVPTRGLRLVSEGRWFLAAPLSEGGFPQAEINSLFAQPVSSRGSIFVGGRFGTTFRRDAPAELAFTLGGPWRLGAYDREEFRGNHYFLTSLGYQHHVSDLPPLWGGKIFAASWFDAGGAFQDLASPDVKYQGSAGFIMETRLGPFSLVGAVGKGGRGKVYFTFGRFF